MLKPTSAQKKRIDALMTTAMSQWPTALTETCHNVSVVIGISGDVFYATATAYVLAGEPSVSMSYTEVSSIWER